MSTQSKVEQVGEFVTLHEMAHRLRTTPNAIYLWMRRNRIQAVKVGQTLVVRPSDIEDYEPKTRGRASRRK